MQDIFLYIRFLHKDSMSKTELAAIFQYAASQIPGLKEIFDNVNSQTTKHKTAGTTIEESP